MQRQNRGYALMIVLLVLALMSVGLGTLLYFLEASALTTGSMLERRRVFYACDGIGRAATVLAQRYMTVPAPTTNGLINFVCTAGGGGCCATSVPAPAQMGPCSATGDRVAFANDPDDASPTALPVIVPSGFKIRRLKLESLAETCFVDADCVDGTCINGRCRTVAPLPNGPFEGMNARQDVIAIDVRAEHLATSGFACRTQQTISLGKIAMFQFFLFSDMAFTDWHPGPEMRATGRMHANGDLAINPGSPVFIERVTASGDLRCMPDPGTGMVMANCPGSNARIANRANPDMLNAAHFSVFQRINATWAQDALTIYANNAQDQAHNVPRLALPIIGSPLVQQGRTANNSVIANTNIDGGVPVTNSRLLIDPVRPGDSPDVAEQKFAFKADIRIINGVWYLRNPANRNDWPGIAIWSDHPGHYTTKAHIDFVGGDDVGQGDLAASLPTVDTFAGTWASRVPQRFSYYAAHAIGGFELGYDLNPASDPLTLTAPFAQRAVVSYGALFRDTSAGETGAVWRPGARTLVQGAARSLCGQANPAGGPEVFDMVDVLSLENGAADACAARPRTRAYGLLAAARSGFRNGYSEFDACGSTDDTGGCGAARVAGNVMPLNFDLAAFQEALADQTPGELGSYFCAPTVASCARFMGAPFNGIVYIGAPYPQAPAGAADDAAYVDATAGSERGYGTDGGVNTAHPLRSPPVDDTAALQPAWPAAVSAAHVPLLDAAGVEQADDETPGLPVALCTDSATPGAMATDGPAPPACPVTKAADAAVSWISGIRVINARRVNSNTPPTTTPVVADAGSLPGFPGAPVLSAAAVGQLPKGITIATNLPVYVVGDVNLTSDAWSPSTTVPWVPVLVAGDTIHPLSNGWDDRNARWAISTADTQRRAVVTRYNMEMLAGWGMTQTGARSGGIHNFPRFLENWGDGGSGNCKGTANFSVACPAIILGSLVIGHHRVYTPGVGPEQTPGGIGRSPPRRDWGFDRHLNDLEKQPPGAPIYDVAAIKQWNRN